jgi:transcriptional regulator with XRE-family HTH domain
METKQCTKCKQEKSLVDFPKSGGKGRLSSWCRSCHSSKYKEARDRERERELRMSVLGNFPERIKDERLKRNMTQRELGEITGVTHSQVRLWEKGLSVPHQKTLRLIYDFFEWDFPVEWKADNGGRLPIRIAKCKNCQRDFPIYKMDTKFCSRSCQSEWMSTNVHGEAHPSWKGGRYIDGGSGYIKTKSPNHPKADGSSYVLEHRLVMEEHLGRYLLPNERVHHKNGIRKDNRIENLELWYIARKDPSGQRMEDIMREFLSQPEIINPQEVETAFRRVFKV